METKIVAGIDISKHFSDMCILSPDNTVIKELHFTHDHAGLNQAVSTLYEFEKRYGQGVAVIMESTSHYHRIPYYFFKNSGLEVIVINPLQSHAIKNISIRQIKTDKIDAYRIALLYRLQHFEATEQPVDILFDLRGLTRQYGDIIKSRTMYSNQLVAYLDQAFPSFRKVFKIVTKATPLALLQHWQTPQALLGVERTQVCELIRSISRSGSAYSQRKTDMLYEAAVSDVQINIQAKSSNILVHSTVSIIASLNENLNMLQNEVKRLVHEDEYASTQVALLSTIPGISWFGAALLLGEIGDIARFKKPAQLVAYCGLDPSQRQSGMFKGSKNKISKRGCRYIRRMLNMSAVTSVTKNSTGAYNNPVLAEYYLRKSQTKPKKVVLCAVMNKMTHIIFAVLRDQKPFVLRYPDEHATLLHTKKAA